MVKTISQTILYYPYINIKNEQWIRNALLYWDNISSIVPYTHYDELSPELLYLKEIFGQNSKDNKSTCCELKLIDCFSPTIN